MRCGVYSDAETARKNETTSIGLTFLFPTILEPSHKSKESQKIYMIVGVPEVARNRKAALSTVRTEPNIATSDLNQRLMSNTMRSAVKTPIIIDGSLMEIRFRPKRLRLSFCRRWYGRSIIFPCWMKSVLMLLDLIADCISAELRPPGATFGRKISTQKNAIRSPI